MSDGFGRFLTLGVEEELMLVDERTLALAPGVGRILDGSGGRLKTELFECLVETNTPVCESAEQALQELAGLRGEVDRRARAAGLRFLAAGLHPFSPGEGQPVVPKPRYLAMQEELGAAVQRQVVCGLHVHVGMPDRNTCLRALEGVLAFLPELLSLAANSPYDEGEETGVRSTRIGRVSELPRTGAPPPLDGWSDWEAAAAGRDYTRLWWDVRPHPRLGTLEVRIPDQQTAVRRSGALAALVQALAAEAAGSRPAPVDRAEYARRRAAGASGGLPLDGLAAAVEPAARSLGTWDAVSGLLAEPPEADRQLAVGRAEGVEAVAADLAARSLESPA